MLYACQTEHATLAHVVNQLKLLALVCRFPELTSSTGQLSQLFATVNSALFLWEDEKLMWSLSRAFGLLWQHLPVVVRCSAITAAQNFFQVKSAVINFSKS